MGQGTVGAGSDDLGLKVVKEKVGGKIVLEDIEIRTKVVEVQVPKFVQKIVELPVYTNKEIIVMDVKVVNREVETQTFKLKENIVEVDKPSYKEVIVEVPRFISKEIISPVIKDVVVEREVLRVVEKIKVEEKVVEVITYKLVEEIIKVPKIQYVPTEIERIVWKDVYRERCDKCGKEVTG
jgi:hypothetical protein